MSAHTCTPTHTHTHGRAHTQGWKRRTLTQRTFIFRPMKLGTDFDAETMHTTLKASASARVDPQNSEATK